MKKLFVVVILLLIWSCHRIITPPLPVAELDTFIIQQDTLVIQSTGTDTLLLRLDQLDSLSHVYNKTIVKLQRQIEYLQINFLSLYLIMDDLQEKLDIYEKYIQVPNFEVKHDSINI